MSKWVMPPSAAQFDYAAAAKALESEVLQPVTNQHVVSKVVLKGFTALYGPRQERLLGRFDIQTGRELHPRGLDGCGKVNGFIEYASGSAEALWKGVEDHLGPAIASAGSGTLHQDKDQVNTIKDCIALHLVRTRHYRRVHEKSWEQARDAVRKEVLDNRQPMLLTAFRERYGVEPAGPEALESFLDDHLGQWGKLEQDGKILRVSVEQTFYRVRSMFDNVSVEVLHAPQGKEFIISDAPAFTFRHEPNQPVAQVRMAIGDSHGVAMPVSSRCMVTVGSPQPKEAELSPEFVDHLNEAQVHLAERQVYYLPGSSVSQLVKATLAQARKSA